MGQATGSIVVIGGTAGIGEQLARHYAAGGDEVVIAGRDSGRASEAAERIGGATRGLAVDLTDPERIAEALSDIGPVRHLVLCAIERDNNTVREFDIARGRSLVTLKLVGYTEVVHALVSKMTDDASIVVFGGLAKDRPYPGSLTVSMVNSGVVGMVHAMAVELAPIRVNGVHPGIVGDTPSWRDKPPEALEGVRSRTPLGRLASMDDVVHATAFLLENPAVTGINLEVEGGILRQ